MPTKGQYHPIEIGRKFGQVTVTGGPIFQDPNNVSNRNVYYFCKCDCGRRMTVLHRNLMGGVTTRCKECVKAHRSEMRTTHGLSRTPEAHMLYSIIHRCTDPKDKSYPNYGGRGIKVDPRYLEPNGQGMLNWFEDLKKLGWDRKALEDAGRFMEVPSIDRIDPRGDYTFNNLRIITMLEQQRNKRFAHIFEVHGKTYSISEAARALNIDPTAIKSRLQHGWSDEAISYWLEHLPNGFRKNPVTGKYQVYDKSASRWVDFRVPAYPGIYKDPRYDPTARKNANRPGQGPKVKYKGHKPHRWSRY